MVLSGANLVVVSEKHVKSVEKCGVRSGGWVSEFESVLVRVDVLSCKRSDGGWILWISRDGFSVIGWYASVLSESVWSEK